MSISTRKRNFSLDAKNKIFLPSIFTNETDLDSKKYLKYLSNKSVRHERIKSTH